MTVGIHHTRGFQNADHSFLSRVEDIDAVNLTQAAVSSIARWVTLLPDGTPAEANPAPVVSATIFDALQTGANWDRDDEGYNFRDDFGASKFTLGNRDYLIEYIITPATGNPFPGPVFEHHTLIVKGG